MNSRSAALCAVGIDLGGTQVRAALVNGNGERIARAALPTDKAGGPPAVVEQIAALVAEVSRAAPGAVVPAIGLSAPGPLDPDAGVVREIPTLPGWRDVPVTRLLGERLGRPVVLEHDGVAAAIAEWKFGAGRGVDDLVYVTVSTGIGGGVIADGRVLRGRLRMAGHVGHITVAPQGRLCPCGNTGCWEAHASGTALAQIAREALATQTDGLLASGGTPPGPREVFAAARAGDPLACRLVREEAEWLGLGIANLLHVYSPQLLLLGGGLMESFDLLEPGILAQVRMRALQPFRDVPIRRAALGADCGLVGAASLVLPEVMDVDARCRPAHQRSSPA